MRVFSARRPDSREPTSGCLRLINRVSEDLRSGAPPAAVRTPAPASHRLPPMDRSRCHASSRMPPCIAGGEEQGSPSTGVVLKGSATRDPDGGPPVAHTASREVPEPAALGVGRQHGVRIPDDPLRAPALHPPGRKESTSARGRRARGGAVPPPANPQHRGRVIRQPGRSRCVTRAGETPTVCCAARPTHPGLGRRNVADGRFYPGVRVMPGVRLGQRTRTSAKTAPPWAYRRRGGVQVPDGPRSGCPTPGPPEVAVMPSRRPRL